LVALSELAQRHSCQATLAVQLEVEAAVALRRWLPPARFEPQLRLRPFQLEALVPPWVAEALKLE